MEPTISNEPNKQPAEITSVAEETVTSHTENEKIDTTTTEKSNTNKQAIGLPEIAESRKLNKWIIIMVVIVFSLFFIHEFFSHLTPTHKSSQSTVSDDFQLIGATPQNNTAQSAPSSPIITPSTNATSSAQNQANTAQLQAEKAKAIEEEQKVLEERLRAPMLIVNNRTQSTEEANTETPNSSDPNTRFLNAVSTQSARTVYASVIPQFSDTIAEGTVIHAILETAIDSDLPGYVRAIVSEPVYSEDDSQVLISPGSRLIGQYKSQLQQAQTRLFVVWTEVIEPNGVSIQLNSPGIDNLGRAGMEADKVDTHFWKKFGTAVLLSVLSAGASNTDVSSEDADNASQSYREAVSQSLSQTASDSMSQTLSIPPTLYINQGKPIMVFVIHRLNFMPVLQQAAQKINVFSS